MLNSTFPLLLPDTVTAPCTYRAKVAGPARLALAYNVQEIKRFFRTSTSVDSIVITCYKIRMNITINNVSDNISSFARGQRVAVEWEGEGEVLATIYSVHYWGNIAIMTLTYDDARLEWRADKCYGAYRDVRVNDPRRWSAKFRMV